MNITEVYVEVIKIQIIGVALTSPDFPYAGREVAEFKYIKIIVMSI